jgi:hypothetical protein
MNLIEKKAIVKGHAGVVFAICGPILSVFRGSKPMSTCYA